MPLCQTVTKSNHTERNNTTGLDSTASSSELLNFIENGRPLDMDMDMDMNFCFGECGKIQ